MTWDPSLYMKFGNERTQPSIDLVGRIELTAPSHIVDLGCGPGNSTQVLRNRWRDAHIVGLDNSPEMIRAAREAYPLQEWELQSIEAWRPAQPFDLVYSNATLQWLKHHDALFPRLFQTVAVNGALAVQMPHIQRSSFRHLIYSVADDPRWHERMGDARNETHVEPTGFYYDALIPLAKRLDIWETDYMHVMSDHAAIVEWIRATSLRPFLAALNDDIERKAFEESMLVALKREFAPQADGKVIFPFKRLFIIAYK